MKRTKKIIGLILALVLCLSFALAACDGGENNTTGAPGTTSPTGTAGTTQPSNSQTDPSGELKITVTPAEMEMYAGEEIDLMLGVTVNNEDATLRISDDNEFDKDTPGTYTITYEATLGETKVNATRTITVLNAKSDLAVEVTHNHLGDTKWQGKVMAFKNGMYQELSASAELSAQTGIFKNVSDSPIVLSVGGSYGCSAIIDANGVVLEGRDGANSKLVNAQNPERASSSVTTITIGGESVSVSSAFAKEMTIPAGGYAIVVQSNAFGSTADTDGRGFMNYNVICMVGNVIRLYWVDTDETLTPYINQQPTVTGNNKVLVQLGDKTFDLNTAIQSGLSIKDDNGTFALDDDIVLDAVTIVDNGGFDVEQVGTYIITLSVSDGELTTEFTREVEVKSDGIGTLFIGENKMNVSLDRVAIDQELTAVGNYAFIIYTSNYTGTIDYANGWGIAFVVDEYGVIVRIYDGANGKYYDAENDGVVDANKCTPAGYLTESFASLQPGETLIVAPNGGDNTAEGGSRWFLNKYKIIGATVSGIGMQFKTTDMTISINGAEFTAPEGKWLFNADVTPAEAAELLMIIFNKDYAGTVEINGFGCAIVLDQYGVLIEIYDAANGGFWTAAGKSTDPMTFDTKNYATVAFAELQEGETLIIFPNGGDNAHRQWALDLRGLKGTTYFGEIASLTGFTFAEKISNEKTISINGAEYTAAEGKWLYNTAIEKAQAQNYQMLIFDKNFEGTFETNGYGCAIVLDKYGVLVKIYDAANGGFWTAEGKAASMHFDVNNYASVAFSELQDGELLIIFPNGGDNAHRQWALDLRGLKGTTYFGEVATLTGFTFEKKGN